MGFLVLGRKLDEKIVINGDIEIVVVEINCRKNPPVVRLGINAPKEIPVHRKEVYDQIQEEEIKSRNAEIEVTDYEKCPFCGESEITPIKKDSNNYIFKCGYSGTENKVNTVCQNIKKS